MSTHHQPGRVPSLSADLRTMAHQLATMHLAGLIVGTTNDADLEIKAMTITLDQSADRAEDLEWPPALPLSFAANVVPFRKSVR